MRPLVLPRPAPAAAFLVTLVLTVACGSGSSRPAAGSPETRGAHGAHGTPGPSPAGHEKVTGLLTLAEARRYMVTLINRDRATQGLKPVTLDEGPATGAGQRHAEDMAHHGFLGHWGTDGSVPEHRYTEAGGTAMVLENASCVTDENERGLVASPRIDPRQVEETEAMFFHELPPNDGHRKNILKPQHTRVGIGIGLAAPRPSEIVPPCFTQEFVDEYGTYRALPRRAKVGETLHVEATLEAPASAAGIGLARVELPRALSPAEANKRRVYPVPPPYQMYWPKGYKTPIPVTIEGRGMRLEVPLTEGGKPGLYEVSVWAKVPGQTDLAIVSLRTILVER